MNWAKIPEPQMGDLRTRTVFAWLPHEGRDGRIHWLERCEIREQYNHWDGWLNLGNRSPNPW